MAHRPLIGVVPLWDDKLNSLWMLPGYFDGIIEAGGIQQFSCLFGHISEVTAVETDSVIFQRNTGISHFFKNTDCIWHAGF